ncbi:MAG: type II toxin-antitoxin system VapC family toxin [Pseudomonadota bacterium]
MAKGTNYVLDSFVLIGYLENEPFAQEIEDLLYLAEKGVTRLYLHALHLGEVYYITLREQGQAVADLAYARIKRFPLKFVETINEELLLTAAALKAHYPISYADSFAAALAKVNNALLLTGDPEFRILEKDGILGITWLT